MFFDNDFKYQPFILNNLERIYDYYDVDVLYSPNITTGGDLDKSWAIENGKRVLYKSSNTFLGLEPINEYIASKICEILNLNHVNYDIKILSNLNKKLMVSSCETFINGNLELIPASTFVDLNSTANISFNKYVKYLSTLKIENVKEDIQKMILLDLIMSNHDRHLNNFGVIRDSNNLNFIGLAPIYDTSRSMMTEYPPESNEEERFCLFSCAKATKNECFELIEGLSLTKTQVKKLKEIPKLYEEVLNKYYDYTNLKIYKTDLRESLIKLITANIDNSLKYIIIQEKKMDN